MLHRVSTVSAVHRKWLNDFFRCMYVTQGIHSVCSSQKVTEWLHQIYACYTRCPQYLQFTESDWMTLPDICMLYKVSTVSAVHRKWLKDFPRYMHVTQGVHAVLPVCSLQKVTDFRRYMYVIQCVHTVLAVRDIPGYECMTFACCTAYLKNSIRWNNVPLEQGNRKFTELHALYGMSQLVRYVSTCQPAVPRLSLPALRCSTPAPP